MLQSLTVRRLGGPRHGRDKPRVRPRRSRISSDGSGSIAFAGIPTQEWLDPHAPFIFPQPVSPPVDIKSQLNSSSGAPIPADHLGFQYFASAENGITDYFLQRQEFTSMGRGSCREGTFPAVNLERVKVSSTSIRLLQAEIGYQATPIRIIAAVHVSLQEDLRRTAGTIQTGGNLASQSESTA
jgi:hypothetical protein